MIEVVLFGIVAFVLFMANRSEKNAKASRKTSEYLADMRTQERIRTRFARGDLGYFPLGNPKKQMDREFLLRIREIREDDGKVYVRYRYLDEDIVEKKVFLVDATSDGIVCYGMCASSNWRNMGENENEYFSIKWTDFIMAFSSRGNVGATDHK